MDRRIPDTTPIVELDNVAKIYRNGSENRALDGISITFPARSFSTVMGPSGSGKSTLLHCAAGLDRPTSGRVLLAGEDLSGLREPALTKQRRRHVGFVFQQFNLIDSLTVWHNVLLPQRLSGQRPDRKWANEVLAKVGLADRKHSRPAELSGGQQQRVAIARALAARPDVIFADEPTGALDLASGREVLALLRQSVDAYGAAVIMVTHDPAAAAVGDRVVFLADGRVAGTLTSPTAAQIADWITSMPRAGQVIS